MARWTWCRTEDRKVDLPSGLKDRLARTSARLPSAMRSARERPKPWYSWACRATRKRANHQLCANALGVAHRVRQLADEGALF